MIETKGNIEMRMIYKPFKTILSDSIYPSRKVRTPDYRYTDYIEVGYIGDYEILLAHYPTYKRNSYMNIDAQYHMTICDPKGRIYTNGYKYNWNNKRKALQAARAFVKERINAKRGIYESVYISPIISNPIIGR